MLTLPCELTKWITGTIRGMNFMLIILINETECNEKNSVNETVSQKFITTNTANTLIGNTACSEQSLKCFHTGQVSKKDP